MNLVGFLWASGALWAGALAQDAPVLYDAYFGKPVAGKREEFLASVVNGTGLCTVPVRPCRKDEGRRVDGTCSNPRHPSRGATLTPFQRLLPPQFGPASSLRSAEDGSELPSTRVLRTTLLGDGYFRDPHFTNLATNTLVGTVGDSVDLFYLLRYAVASDCCLGNVRNQVDPQCIPIPVPQDDPYLRRTGIRCMNLTRVETYQDYGCLPRTLPSERYNRVTPLLDLSLVYGNTEARSRSIRAMQGGLLAFRMEGNREVPAGIGIFCLGSRGPEILNCYNFGDNFQSNLVPGGYLEVMWFFREHNRFARRLAAMNPCWDDEKLFQTAREINIAQWQYIVYYELIAEIIGRKNALLDGIIFDTVDYVNDFDPGLEPGVYHEYTVATRWFHTFQPALNDLYRNGRYMGSRTAVDDELRSGILAFNNTEADMTQGSFIQPAEKFDKVLDPDLSQRVFGELQAASDLPAIDMMRGRDHGLPPYNYYRKFCGNKPATKWEDFYDTIDKDKVEMLSRMYESVDEVELMVAIYVEKLLPDAFVPPTLYCIMAHNLLLWRQSDKFFFEHGGFPAALTLPQLNEVRRTSMAKILCESGDGVKEIQPHALLRIGPWNELTPCDQIPGMDLDKWKDAWCPVDKE